MYLGSRLQCSCYSTCCAAVMCRHLCQVQMHRCKSEQISMFQVHHVLLTKQAHQCLCTCNLSIDCFIQTWSWFVCSQVRQGHSGSHWAICVWVDCQQERQHQRRAWPRTNETRVHQVNTSTGPNSNLLCVTTHCPGPEGQFIVHCLAQSVCTNTQESWSLCCNCTQPWRCLKSCKWRLKLMSVSLHQPPVR